MTTDTTGQPRSSPNSEAITIGVLVPVVLIIIAVAVILAIVLLIFIWRRSKYSDPPDNEKAPESRVIAQEENRGGGRGEKVVPGNQTQTGAGLDPVYTQIVTAREEQPPPYFPKSEPPINSEELNKMNNKERKVVEPTLYDNRSSLVESDFHLPADTNLNSAVELVTICEGDEAAYTSRTRY